MNRHLLIPGLLFTLCTASYQNPPEQDSNLLMPDADPSLLRTINKMRYFPPNSFAEDDAMDSSLAETMGAHLYSMEQKSLYVGRKRRHDIVCRFLLVPTFSHPTHFSIKISSNSTIGKLVILKTHQKLRRVV